LCADVGDGDDLGWGGRIQHSRPEVTRAARAAPCSAMVRMRARQGAQQHMCCTSGHVQSRGTRLVKPTQHSTGWLWAAQAGDQHAAELSSPSRQQASQVAVPAMGDIMSSYAWLL
jgi:hypothetical protein